MADAPPSDPIHQLVHPQPAAADANVDRLRIPAGHSSMRHARPCEMHRGHGRCIRRQPALSLAAAGIHHMFGPRYRVLVPAAVA